MHVICPNTAFSPFRVIGLQARVFGIGTVGGISAPLGQTKGSQLCLFWLLHRWLAIPTYEQKLISTPVPYLSCVAPDRNYFEK